MGGLVEMEMSEQCSRGMNRLAKRRERDFAIAPTKRMVYDLMLDRGRSSIIFALSQAQVRSCRRIESQRAQQRDKSAHGNIGLTNLMRRTVNVL